MKKLLKPKMLGFKKIRPKKFDTKRKKFKNFFEDKIFENITKIIGKNKKLSENKNLLIASNFFWSNSWVEIRYQISLYIYI